jgi:hypothetical protein
MKKLIVLLIILFAFYKYIFYIPSDRYTSMEQDFSMQAKLDSEANTQDSSAQQNLIEKAFDNTLSDIQVQGIGTVIKILRDDFKGSRHQKFILRLTSGQTLLIAHNIDLAPRINSIKTGDIIEFNGEYEWNSKGGIIHWTHHDPKGYHEAGWLKHKGRTYQ